MEKLAKGNSCGRGLQGLGWMVLLGVVWGAGTVWGQVSPASGIHPAMDTYLTEHSGLGGAGSVHGDDDKLHAIGSTNFRSYPLIQFDLSTYAAGQTVVNDATLELYLDGVQNNTTARTVEVYKVLEPWDDATVTYNNFGSVAGVQLGTDVESDPLDVQDILFRNAADAGYVRWTIPAAVIQDWIDHPETNYGVLINNAATPVGFDLRFDALEGTNRPRLAFENVSVQASDGAFENHTEVGWVKWDLDDITYRVSRIASSGDGTTQTLALVSSEDVEYIDTEGTTGVQYTYMVEVIRNDQVVGAGVDEGRRVMRAPTGVQASDGRYEDRVRVSWTDNSQVEAEYVINRDGSEIARLPANTTSYEDTEADGSDTSPHDYAVMAVDAAGNASAIGADTGWRGAVLPPTSVTASYGLYADKVVIVWSGAITATTQYRIVRKSGTTQEVLAAAALGDHSDGLPLRSFEDPQDNGAGIGAPDDGVAYSYCVSALTGGADSDASVEVCDEGGIGILPVPRQVRASDDTFDDKVQVTWVDLSGLEDGFSVYRRPAGEAFTYDDLDRIATTSADVTTYNDVDAAFGVEYDYRVIAFSDLGGASAPSNVDVGQRSFVLPPENLQATQGTFEDKVEMSWESFSTTVQYFNLYRDGVLIKTLGRDTRFYIDTGGEVGTEDDQRFYELKGVAVPEPNQSAAEVFSDAGMASGFKGLAAPTGVVASDDEYEDRVLVTWEDNSQAETGYRLYRSDEASGLVEIGEVEFNRTSYEDKMGKPGQAYTYKVRAFNTYGESAAGEDQGRRVLRAPTEVEATDGDFENRVVIRWLDNSDAETGYVIKRDGEVIGEVGSNETTFEDGDPDRPLVLGHVYSYSVFPQDGSGDSSQGGEDNGHADLLGPEAFSASTGYQDRVQLTWMDVSDANSGYRIFRQDIPLVDDLPGTAISYTDVTAEPGASYEYCIESYLDDEVSTQRCADGARLAVPDPPSDFDQVLMAKDGKEGDSFGYSVAMDGTWAVVGAPENSNGNNPPDDGTTAWGKAYVFKLEYEGGKWQWIQKQVLEGDHIEDVDRRVYFGQAVDIHGDLVVVSAPLESAECGAGGDCAQGAVYIFDKNNGEQIEKLNVPSDLVNRSFGYAVALHEELLAIAIPSQRIDKRGLARFYVPNEDETARWRWISQTTNEIDNENMQFNDLFGVSIDIYDYSSFSNRNFLNNENENIWAFIGDVPGTFDRGGKGFWKFHPKIIGTGSLTPTRANRQPNWEDLSIRNRGFSLHINQNYLITGGPPDPGNDQKGRAWLYFVPDITHGIELRNDPDIKPYRHQFDAPGEVHDFGTSVAVNGQGDRVLIGAKESVYFYSSVDDTWSFERLEASGRVLDLALDNNWGLAGVPHRSLDGENGKGQVFAIELEEALRGPAPVSASDGKFNNRVQITWQDNDDREESYWIFRDGEQLGTEGANATSFSDFDAVPGRVYTYCVSAVVDDVDESARICDRGWRPLNGSITGRIAAQGGGGVVDVKVCLNPTQNNGILFDGIEGDVFIEQPRVPQDAFTLEMWLRTSNEEDNNAILFYYGGDNNGPPFGALVVKDNKDVTIRIGSSEHSTGVAFNDGRWHHLAITWRKNDGQLLLYKDGLKVANTTFQTGIEISNTDNLILLLGANHLDLAQNYRGQLDEVRVWDRVLSSEEILQNMNRRLEGTEDGLLGYWPFDENEGYLVADHSLSNSYGRLQRGAYWSQGSDQVEYCSLTDSEGNYAMTGIDYGQETAFKVVPIQAGRSFRPAYRTETLNTQNPVQNQIDMIDMTAYTVSGRVLYKDTNCPVPGTQIQTGTQVVATDNDGRYNIALDIGTHPLEISLEGHAFDQDLIKGKAKTVNVAIKDADVTGLDFTDFTTSNFSGFIGGGCERLIGDVKIEIRSEDNCLIREEIVQGAFSFDLPPLNYSVRVLDVENVPLPLNKSAVLLFFERTGALQVDLTQGDQTRDLLYRTPLRLAIEGVTELIDDENEQCLGVPILQQGDAHFLTINVYEDFGVNGVCELEEGTVSIFDEISDQSGEAQILTIKDGIAKYRITALTPSVFEGRKDAAGIDRSYQKSITAIVALPGLEPASATEWVVVAGERSREGTEFISAVSDPIPLVILRDPPGDGSYSYIEKGHTITNVFDYEINFRHADQKYTFKRKRGDKYLFALPFINFSFPLVVKGDEKEETQFGLSIERDNKIAVTFTALERFSTSSDQVYIGERGDVFIGAALNFLFGRKDKIQVVSDGLNSCRIIRSETIGFEPTGFNSTFAYTHAYIEDQLIPSLEDIKGRLVNNDPDITLPDSLEQIDHTIKLWKAYLAQNRELKRLAQKNVSSSFDIDGPDENRLRDLSLTQGDVPGFVIKTKKSSIENVIENSIRFLITSIPYVGFAFEVFAAGTGVVPEVEDEIDLYQLGLSIGELDELEGKGLPQLDKLISPEPRNRSFSAGADYEFVHESNVNRIVKQKVLLWKKSRTKNTKDFEIRGNGGTLEIAWTAHSGRVISLVDENDTRRQAIGYVLSDDDFGDAFTVDIKEDGVYPTPIFDVRAGLSSNPWESWQGPDPETGEIKSRMVPRDQALISIDPNSQPTGKIPPGDEAKFTLLLKNDSQSGEAREYHLRAWHPSNPKGAAININGSPMDGVLSYFIEPQQEIAVTMSVGRGPRSYSYDDLQLMFYPPAEYALWQQQHHFQPLRLADEVTFDVFFESPCSEVDFFRPSPGWTFNRADLGQSLELILDDFDLSDDRLERIEVQYRRQGTDGVQGPSAWQSLQTLQADALTQDQSHTIDWDLDNDLAADGVYELRAFTVCESGRVHSQTIPGTVDRKAPQVLGTPAPADGRLSLGETIALNFDEIVQCDALQNDNISLTKGDGTSIDVDWTCDGRSLFLTPSSWEGLEGEKLTAALAPIHIDDGTEDGVETGIVDLAGNPQTDDITWDFWVRRQAFTWDQGVLLQDIDLGAAAEFSAALVNGSEQVAGFTLEMDEPDWLVALEPPSTLGPGATAQIRLAVPEAKLGDLKERLIAGNIAPDANNVIASQTVHVTAQGANLGTAVLQVDVQIVCIPPDWQIEAADFAHQMFLVAEVFVGGEVSRADDGDLIAAFVGDQLRGVGQVELVPTTPDHRLNLAIHSNDLEGETVRFEIWDADACIRYPTSDLALPFADGAFIGTLAEPFALNARLDDGAEHIFHRVAIQHIPLDKGWNWVSLNVRPSDGRLFNVLSSLFLRPGDQIFGAAADNIVDADLRWGAEGLQAFDPLASYQLRLQDAGTLTVYGEPIDPQTPIPLTPGWNWIPYLPQVPLPINQALKHFDAAPGDIIRGPSGFAQYVELNPHERRWLGSLTRLEPGQGYRLLSATAKTLKYPAAAPGPVLLATKPVAAVALPEVEGQLWQPNPAAQPHSMAISAALVQHGRPLSDEGQWVGAFVGEQLRGVGQLEYVEHLDQHRVFMVIHGGGVAQEEVEFKVFDPQRQALDVAGPGLAFEADALHGSVEVPVVLEVGGDGSAVPRGFYLFQNNPNPFNPSTQIAYQLAEDGPMRLAVYNVLGQPIRVLQEGRQRAGSHRVIWDGMDAYGRPVASGLYFYRLDSAAGHQTRRMMLLK